MRAVIFVGSKDFVLENRATGRENICTGFDKIGPAYRMEGANDPVSEITDFSFGFLRSTLS